MKIRFPSIIVATALALVGGIANADYIEDQKRLILKSEQPEVLNYVVYLENDKCPSPRSTYENIVDGVLTRSRIKGVVGSDGTHLETSTVCLEEYEGNSIYSIEIQWSNFTGGVRGEPVRYHVAGTGYLGIGPPSEIESTLRRLVEDVVTTYIYAAGRRYYLGIFTNKEDAIAARRAAEIKYGYDPDHGCYRR